MSQPDPVAASDAYAAKQPFATKDQLVALAGCLPDAFPPLRRGGYPAQHRGGARRVRVEPGFREYFAVKANPNPSLIKILTEYGCGLDCSSGTELMIAEAVGVTGHGIMFSSNDTPAADFRLARELGAIVNFDDISHIPFFEEVAGPIPRP